MAKKTPATVEEYIADAAPEARDHLVRMQRILGSVAPEGTEAVKWGVPVYWQKRVLFGFAAYRTHLSFGPGPAAVEHFAPELADYRTGKGTIQFPYDRPVPEDLVRRIAEYCL